MTNSKIFPGTTRTITVYVPAAYQGDKPACVYVGLDGLGFKAATVFDNLIAQHAMPVTIGVGLSPGVVESVKAPENPRFDRSFEFDSRSDRLARFLLEEVLPAVTRHSTPDGRAIRLSENGNDRAIGGGSTGAIGAFTAAWERPDAFSRVFSAIGTYVGMRGGESYYVLVRKTEPKALRVFMQDGAHDEWGGGPEMGDWWMSNQTMERALAFAGYDVRHIWGVGTHNGHQGTAVFPEAMRWLWRGWPSPVEARAPGNPVLEAILQPKEAWAPAAEGCPASTNLAANPAGEVFVSNGGMEKLSPVTSNGKPMGCGSAAVSAPIAFGPDGKVYQASSKGDGGITVSRPGGGKIATEAKGLHVRSFVVRSNGDIYATAENARGEGAVWLVRSSGEKTQVGGGLKGAAGIALSPDGLWLFAAQNRSRTGVSYRVQADGSLDARELFYDFYVPTWADDSGAGGIAMDEDGRAYVATRTGIQVFDRNGRVTAILPLPGNEAATSVCFGGDGFHTIYAAGAGKIYRRRLRIVGVPAWAAAKKLPPWGAG
jgi:sugar lactone lactonase YvrE/enterochelin esterase-like enzyme